MLGRDREGHMPILQMKVLGPQRGSHLAKGIQITSTDLTELRSDSKVKAAGNNLYEKEKRRKGRGARRRERVGEREQRWERGERGWVRREWERGREGDLPAFLWALKSWASRGTYPVPSDQT